MNEMIVFDTKNYNPTRRGEKTVKSLRLGTVRTVVILSLSVQNWNVHISSLIFGDKSRRQYNSAPNGHQHRVANVTMTSSKALKPN